MSLPEGEFDLAFTVHATTYRGQRGVQLEWIDATLQKMAIDVKRKVKEPKGVDFRNFPDPSSQLERIREIYPDLEVWAESVDKKLFGGKDRFELAPAANLAIVTIPPSRTEIEQAVNSVAPEVILYLAHDPGMDSFDNFVPRLAGLVKYAINKYDGDLDLDRLAAASAQRKDVIKAGLRFLAAKGSIHILQDSSLSMKVEYGNNKPQNTVDSDELRLRAYLAETKAFRKYYQITDLAGLL